MVASGLPASEIAASAEAMMSDTPNHLFSEAEVNRILKRASEMQGDARSGPRIGLTISELQQLAESADIDPRFVAAAALEVSGSGEEDESNIWGGPITLSLKRRIEGAVSDETWDRITSKTRQHFKSPGAISERANTREWSISNKFEGGGANVTLHTRDGYSELEVFWNGGPIAIPFFIIPLVGSLISLPIIFETMNLGGLPGFGMWLLIATTLLGVARLGFGALAKSQRNDVRGFTDGLVALIEEDRAREAVARDLAEAQRSAETGRQASATTQPAGQRAGSPEAGRRGGLDIPEDSDAEADASRSRRRDRA